MGVGTAEDAADAARDHPAVEWPARAGFVLYGVVYLMVAWLTSQLAIGDHPEDVSGQGALQQVAEQPVGGTILWLIGAGFAALVVWDICRLLGRDQPISRRLGAAGRAALFAALGFKAVQVTVGEGGRGGGRDEAEGWTARLLGLPGGTWLVAAVGLGVASFGVWSVIKGFTGRWRGEIELDGRTGFSGAALTWLSRLGYVTRGVAYSVIGGLLGWAAWTHDPDKSAGLDQALSRLRGESYGSLLLGLIAVGFACWGAFQLAKARYLRAE